jgi:predicted ester cyclase
MSDPVRIKAAFAPLRDAMRDFAEGPVRVALDGLLLPDATLHLCHPFADRTGPDGMWSVYAPLLAALPDLERRDMIVMAGRDGEGALWLGTCGEYMGTFIAPWLDVPPTGHLAALRFHEFFRFDGDRVAEVQLLWDIPGLMRQAGVWPLAPGLGREMTAPAPATQNGLAVAGDGAAALRIVTDMLIAMVRHPAEGGPEVMDLPRYWHPRFNWYGPSGIGTARGISGFRNWHQIPFLQAMPDRGKSRKGTKSHLFAEGDYVAVTGWPNMRLTLSHDGWLGLPPTGQSLTLRSLDFWRVEDGLIRENWVLIDLLHVYAQVGIDVFDRLRMFNKSRHLGAIPQLTEALT